MLNDAHSHGVEFRCGDEEPLALRLQVREQLRNAGVGSVVEPAVLLIVFAEFRDCGIHVLRGDEARKGLVQRRADEKRQVMPVALDAEGAQGVLPGLHNAGAGFGQCAVKVK